MTEQILPDVCLGWNPPGMGSGCSACARSGVLASRESPSPGSAPPGPPTPQPLVQGFAAAGAAPAKNQLTSGSDGATSPAASPGGSCGQLGAGMR